MFTIYGERASYYFAASTRTGQQHLAPDYLLWYSLNELAASGVTSLDLLGIGSDLAPHLRTLNTFKTKFATETVAVPPYREIILHPGRYKLCNMLADLKQKIRPLSS
ncbi:peptidoglycan bridge formation glycyltransferase FemA/FemB family protein [uncultured Arcanobacterium sp.]|uniref:peptidoglycan bridge formation glycyltransferase FemA/FemB family protein n=1 Tax=uncultured Arcanobacterium sp. TaxID=487520 RepID=UPI002620B9FA|nr:peptidoglycan bridge formation glycyltransferase FemA/FemB family protein [uncultured Arcanobacterium sp.]